MPQPFMSGKSLRLSRDALDPETGLPPDVEQNIARMVGSATMDFSRWSRDGLMLYNPRIRYRTDPRRIMWDLLADKGDAESALQWRIDNYSEINFTRFGVEAGKEAIGHWVRGEHGIVVYASPTGVEKRSD